MTKKLQSLINRFNELYPVGSICLWRPVSRDSCEHLTMTVKTAAYEANGMALVFFEERGGCCSIDPAFVKYTRRQFRDKRKDAVAN